VTVVEFESSDYSATKLVYDTPLLLQSEI